jgi:hypothetical protein
LIRFRTCELFDTNPFENVHKEDEGAVRVGLLLYFLYIQDERRVKPLDIGEHFKESLLFAN